MASQSKCVYHLLTLDHHQGSSINGSKGKVIGEEGKIFRCLGTPYNTKHHINISLFAIIIDCYYVCERLVCFSLAPALALTTPRF